MTRFLFWNLNKNEIPGFVSTLAREKEVDVLILAECVMRPERVLEELNSQTSEYQYAWGVSDHLIFFTRFDSYYLRPLFESSRLSIRRLSLPGCEPLLIAAAHLPSKMNYSDESQVFESVQLARAISDVEAGEGHHRTILLGDLNMNPFEAGMVGARGGLNAVPSRSIAARDTRTVQREKYKFFYNPMWNYLGDHADPGGTFYYENSEPVCYFWHMYDQVLLRPALLKDFRPEHVRILSDIRGVSLLENGRPDKQMASDHLPVMLELNLRENCDQRSP